MSITSTPGGGSKSVRLKQYSMLGRNQGCNNAAISVPATAGETLGDEAGARADLVDHVGRGEARRGEQTVDQVRIDEKVLCVADPGSWRGRHAGAPFRVSGTQKRRTTSKRRRGVGAE